MLLGDSVLKASCKTTPGFNMFRVPVSRKPVGFNVRMRHLPRWGVCVRKISVKHLRAGGWTHMCGLSRFLYSWLHVRSYVYAACLCARHMHAVAALCRVVSKGGQDEQEFPTAFEAQSGAGRMNPAAKHSS